MMLRTLIATLASALLLGTAAAAPVLRGDVAVTAGIVTVADMFEDAGALAGEGLFRAPLPGTSGLVAIADIKAAATRLGIDHIETNGLTTVRVTRTATVIDEAALTTLIEADLLRRGVLTQGAITQARFTTRFAPVNAEAVPQPATLVSLHYQDQTGYFTARFAIAGQAGTVDVDGALDVMVEAPFLAANLAAGTVLKPEDIIMRPVSQRTAQAGGYPPFEQLVGKQLRRQSQEGVVIAATDVTDVQLIARNDIVTIYFRQGPLTLTVKGQALTPAAQGGSVQVLNLMSKRVISTTAIAPGAVEVSQAPLTLAGL